MDVIEVGYGAAGVAGGIAAVCLNRWLALVVVVARGTVRATEKRFRAAVD